MWGRKCVRLPGPGVALLPRPCVATGRRRVRARPGGPWDAQLCFKSRPGTVMSEGPVPIRLALRTSGRGPAMACVIRRPQTDADT